MATPQTNQKQRTPAPPSAPALCRCGVIAFARCGHCRRAQCRTHLARPNGECRRCERERLAVEHRLDAQRQRQELAERPERLDEFWTAGRKGRIRLIWNDFALGPRGFGREFITPDTDGYPELTDTGEPPRLVRMCITGSVVDVRRDGRRFNGRHFICRWSEFEDAFLAEGMPWLRHTIRHVLLTGHP